MNSEEALPHAIKLIRQAISLKDQNYWLIKVELLNFISNLRFRDIFYLEISQKTHPSLQQEIITSVLMPLICDEDHRIRNAAAAAIVRIVPNLFLPTNQLDGDVITSMASDLMHKRLECFSSSRRPASSFIHHLLPSNECSHQEADDRTINCNLKFITSILEDQLMASMDKKDCTLGAISALESLSSNYCPTTWRNGWSERGSVTRTRLLVSLLTSSANPVVMDIHVHERLVSHISHVLSGLAFECMSGAASEKVTLSECEHENWSAVSVCLPEVALIMESFVGHLFKLVYILSCIASDVTPNAVSGPTAASAKSSSSFYIPLTGGTLSPLRRLSKEGLDFVQKSEAGRKGKESHLPHYLDSTMSKFHEVLRSSFLSYRSSSDFETSRFSGFTSVVLKSISQLLEFCTLSFIGPKTEILIDQINTLISVDASSCVSCVQQLLKSVFGTNLAILSLPEPLDQPPIRHAGHRSSSSASALHHSSNTSIKCNGLYQTIFSNPYSQYSQLYGAKWIASQTLPSHTYSPIEERNSLQMQVRKAFDRRIACLSEKTSMPVTPASADPSTTNIKSFLISYIKMFEPVVIRALKMYTTTSDIGLQSEILNLLSILVKVRVNYCLLDSDFVFLDFVQKQFEFIEGGLIGETKQLVDCIFRFLTLLSYERVDRKQVLPVAKLIQLSDGLLASNQPAKDCVIPALRHLVQDLFLYRIPAKGEPAKELDTQREVVLSTILKICLIPESIELLTLIVQSVRKDSDEKWKKTSRTVMDVVMPHVMKQSLDIRSWADLDRLYQLFESVSPIVFRPADIILTALFAPPADNVLENQASFCRWFSTVLLLMRIMMMQTKEEVILSRFTELRKTAIRVGSHNIICFEDSISTSTSGPSAGHTTGTASEELFAEFFLQTFQLTVSQLSQHSWSGNEFLSTQISHYLLYLTYLFQSGSFRRTSKAAAVVVKKSSSQNSDLSAFSMNNLNDILLQIRSSEPVLLLQWLNVLLLLGFNDSPESGMGDAKSEENNRFFWSQHLQATRDQESVIPAALEMIRQGTIVLLCDFACESMSNAEQMTWLIINHIHEILLWSHELPVRDFIHTIHRNPASSALFIQSINSRCFLLKDPCLTRKLLTAVQFIHPTQSGPLVALLIEQVIVSPDVSPFVTLTSAAQKLAIERIEMILKSESNEEMTSQLSVEDVARLLMLISRRRHRPLFSSLEQLGRVIAQVDVVEDKQEQQVNQKPDVFGKEFLMRFTRHSCSHRSHSHETLNPVVQKMHQEDIQKLLQQKEFVISCLDAGICEEVSSSRRPSVELFGDPASSRNRLLSSALMSLNSQMDQIFALNLTIDSSTGSDDLESALSQLVSFADGFAKLIKIGSNNRSSPESLKTMLSLISLYGDALAHAARNERADVISCCFNVLTAMAETEPLITLLEDEKNFDSLFTIIAAVHCYVETQSTLPAVCEPKKFADLHLVNPEWKKPHEACMRASQLVSFISQKPNAVFCQEIRVIVLSLCRNPVLNSFVMVPPLIWETGSWHPNFCGTFGTTCPTVPSEELRDAEVLTQFTSRISLLGWRSRIQFEEFWMSLLGVISLLQSGDSSDSFDEADVCVICSIAIRGITDLLLQTLLYPLAGNPVCSHYVSLKNENIPHIAHTKYGQKLVNLMETLTSQKQKLGLSKDTDDCHVEYGHISVEFLRKMCKMSSKNNKTSPLSPLSPSSDTSSTSSGSAPISNERVSSVMPAAIQESDLTRVLPQYRDNLDIDLHSCIHFLLDLYNQLISSKTTPPPLAASVSRSLLLLSDLFFEKSQYEWMMETFFHRYKHAVHAEDEVEIQFLVYGIIKCCSVLSIDAESATYEKMKKCVENGLKSPFLSSRIATIQGINCYLLNCKEVIFKGKEESLLTTISEYLMKHLSDQSLPSSSDAEHASLMWDLSFALIQNHMDDFSDNEFGQKIFHLSVAFLGSDQRSAKIRKRICIGLEKLMLSETFAIREADLIVRTCMDRMRSFSPEDESAAFRLILTSIYVFGLSIGSESGDDKGSGSNDDIAAAMEKIAVMFDRLKFCGPDEASLMCSVLPALLVDFFPTQDVMNKVIAEFLSNQQLYPQLIADVLFHVFEFLRMESKTDVIHDWVMLSLSIFAQLDPLPLAAWSLTCFLLSASSSIWAKAIFPCVRDRFGKSDEVDGQMLSVAASHFFSELTKEEDKDLLIKTILSVAVKDTPYQDVLHFQRLNQTE
jgi:huntingtin